MLDSRSDNIASSCCCFIKHPKLLSSIVPSAVAPESDTVKDCSLVFIDVRMAIALLHHFQRLAKSATARQQQLMQRQAIVKSATAQLAGVPNASGDLGRVEHYCAAMLDSEAILSAISVQNLCARLTEPTRQPAAVRARPMIMHLVEQ